MMFVQVKIDLNEIAYSESFCGNHFCFIIVLLRLGLLVLIPIFNGVLSDRIFKLPVQKSAVNKYIISKY